MSVRNISYILLFFILGSTYSCKEPEPYALDEKYEYYPLAVGNTWIYEVDSIIYDDFFNPVLIDTASFEQMESITEQFKDNLGRPTYRIQVSRRANDTLPWVIKNIYYANRDITTAEKTVNNLRFIKLVFPPHIGSEWFGTAFIDARDDLEYLSGWEFEISSIDQPYQLEANSFEKTLTVDHINETNAVEEFVSKEVYAWDIGLIHKEMRILERPNQPFGEWESGFILNMKLKSFTSPN